MLDIEHGGRILACRRHMLKLHDSKTFSILSALDPMRPKKYTTYVYTSNDASVEPRLTFAFFLPHAANPGHWARRELRDMPYIEPLCKRGPCQVPG